MALDAATLALTAAELKTTLTDAKIAKLFEPTRDELVLTLRTRTETYSLLLAAGKLAGIGVCPVGQTDLCQHLPADGVRFGLGHFTGHDQPFGDILQGGLVPEQVVVLEDEGRLFAQAGDVGTGDPAEVEGLAVKGQAAAVGGLQKVQAAQKGRLAGTAGAEDGNDVAFFHGQVYAPEHVQCADHPAGMAARERPDVKMRLLVVGAKGFVNVLNL